MKRTMWFILALILGLSLCFGCSSKEGREVDRKAEATARKIRYWTQTFQYWRAESSPLDDEREARSVSSELNRFLSAKIEYEFTLEQVGVTQEELNQFERRADITMCRHRWDNLFSMQAREYWPDAAKEQLENNFIRLGDRMLKQKISAEDIGRNLADARLFIREHHALQAGAAMLNLYYFETDPRRWSRPSPRQLADRVGWELEMAAGFVLDQPRFNKGDVTVSHADYLAALAYQRMLLDLLDRLRNKEWRYPTSSAKVDLFLEIFEDSSFAMEDIGTSRVELEALRLRVPQHTVD